MRIFSQILFAVLLASPHFACWSDLSAAIQKIKPSVVAVGTFAETDSPRFTFLGTGFVVEAGNWVITNAHVVPEALAGPVNRRLQVQVADALGVRSFRTAIVLRRDTVHDLALLEFDGAAALPVKLALESSVREGASIGLMGFPLGGALGLTLVTHRGIIAAVTSIALPPPSSRYLTERALMQLREEAFRILQLDATAYPGNSGGPVFDVDTAAIVGVVNMVLVKGSKETALSQPSGITYAIPTQFVRQLIEQ